MNHKITALWGSLVFCGLLASCTQQQTSTIVPVVETKPLPAVIAPAPVPASTPVPVKKVVPKAVVKVMPPKVLPPKPAAAPQILPVPSPYHDLVVMPTSLLPVPQPTITPVPVIQPVVSAVRPPPVPVVPKVKAKGVYQGAIQVDNSLRQQYQQ